MGLYRVSIDLQTENVCVGFLQGCHSTMSFKHNGLSEIYLSIMTSIETSARPDL